MKKIRTMASVAAMGATAALVGGVLSPGVAAAQDDRLELSYNVTGSAYVAGMDSNIPIEATVDVQLDLKTGDFDSQFTQTSVPHVKFKAFGMFDSELDVEFYEAAPSSGTFQAGEVDFTLPLQIKLRELTALGFPLMVGENCVQQEPPTLNLGSVDEFIPTEGGSLETVEPYTLSEWSEDCGFSTFLINMNSAGGDNTAEVTLTAK
ncbi:hypothetical protein [Amycolatopsis cihanbeyliensis]|uniref:Ribosomally synthesized peptide with SipW-like signal peptide n=1 Tax=Amycolatopsis cihanbeyliensis TaxID=1128664 RepID=A0A542DR25_AMYCI|nr:hypothetical protein [Amycolatopsis cihanbeyliensis]TQJ05553.1 hypothetical protein FB471_5390 [Amycolatopsis cihanbeyliensis]